jgi:hypothetical protein
MAGVTTKSTKFWNGPPPLEPTADAFNTALRKGVIAIPVTMNAAAPWMAPGGSSNSAALPGNDDDADVSMGSLACNNIVRILSAAFMAISNDAEPLRLLLLLLLAAHLLLS